ncbi:hypothetical protein BCR42DRAFT_22445 [Absidia repens]|uniref:Uncharacterized protein n=1 Tax=Absidia repens TaxID=90262 RepID=A0A1X2IHT6_9FUNG|nr:hypothetical protein BCR42DRAFT_22445 [Absidia repens]
MKAKEKAKNLHTPQFTIRKISSEDDVSGLPRSHCTSQIVSGYADSIRRQRSDSFVHSYNHRKVFHTRTVQKPLQLGADDDDGDVEVDMNENDHGFKPNSNQSSRSDVPSITTTTNTVNSRARNSHTASPKSVAPSSMKSSLHINTNPAATTNRNETGAILEGVLIRRAIRPGSPLTATLPSSQNATLNEPCTPSRLPRITTAALTPTSEISVSPIASATTTTTPSTPSAPWLPPSLITPQHSNITISSLSSGAYDENPILS